MSTKTELKELYNRWLWVVAYSPQELLLERKLEALSGSLFWHFKELMEELDDKQ